MADLLAAVQDFYRKKDLSEGENETAADDGAVALSKVQDLGCRG